MSSKSEHLAYRRLMRAVVKQCGGRKIEPKEEITVKAKDLWAILGAAGYLWFPPEGP
jgi:hypothetical protein